MNATLIKKTILSAAILFALPSIAISAQPENVRHYGKNAPFSVDDLPTSKVKTKLKELPANKREKAMRWLHSFEFTEMDLKHLDVDGEGGVLYTDTFDGMELIDPLVGASDPSLAISPADSFKLHSKPGASNVIFIDVDGHTLTNSAWNSTEPTLQALPFDTDGFPDSFNATEHGQIAEIWHRIAEDYAPFDVDVTTEEPANFGPTTGRILITKNTDANGKAMPYSTAGGVAYVGVWGSSSYANYYSPALVYYNNLASQARYIAEACSHEMGHNMGLSHDGTSTQTYYSGLGSGNVSWAPIMGNSYYNQVTQWSKGEYPDANQQQDDISIIAGKLSFRTDDHGDTSNQPTPLVVDLQGNIFSTTPETDPYNLTPDNKGIIETATDVDFFVFDAGAGQLTIAVSPAWDAFYNASHLGSNLDIEATLYDWNDNVIATSDPLDATDAVITATVPAGQYILSIKGVGNSITPYSDYGSLGQYFIFGNVVPFSPVSDNTAPNPDPMSWMVAPFSQTRSKIAMQATVATDDSGTVQYNFRCVSGQGCADSGWQVSNQFTATGLQPGTTYGYEVLAQDAYGNQTLPSAVAYATTPANAAPQANSGSFATNEDASFNIDLTTLASDADNDPLSFTIQTQPSHGSVVLTNGIVTYAPAANYNGSDSFVYTVNDGFVNASATVSITVNPVNDAPIASISAPSSNSSLTVDFSSNGTYDPDVNDTLAYLWNFGDGTTSTAANPSHTYASPGSYVVTLIVTDSTGLEGTASITTSVIDPNNAVPATPSGLNYTITGLATTGKGKSRVTTGQLSLEWNKAEFATQYKVWSCEEVTSGKGKNKTTTCDYGTTPVATIIASGGSVESFTANLPSATTHYKVSALNQNGSSGFSNEVVVTP